MKGVIPAAKPQNVFETIFRRNQMKHLFKPRVCGLLLTLLLFAGGTQTAFAVGTVSGTTISNSATVNYQVGGIGQTAVLSSPDGLTPTGVTTDFLVDNKVDVVVTALDIIYVSVAPGSLDQVLTFTVRNDGNTAQDFSLVAAPGADPFGGTDNFDATATAVYVENGTTVGFQPVEDVAVYIDELAADAFVTVYVVSSISAAQINGDIAAYTLTADAADAGTGGALGAATSATAGADTAAVDVVLADAAGDTDAQYAGDHSDTSAYQVVTAALAVAKNALVISDPFNLLVNPKAIPGATMEYTITVTNTGAQADNVVVTDPIPANTTFVGGSVGATGAATVAYSEDNAATWIAAPTDPALVTHIRATFVSIADGTVTAQVATVTFEVTIN
jgi:uncharacterized repeat protein (TIGR01451 family)